MPSLGLEVLPAWKLWGLLFRSFCPAQSPALAPPGVVKRGGVELTFPPWNHSVLMISPILRLSRDHSVSHLININLGILERFRNKDTPIRKYQGSVEHRARNGRQRPTLTWLNLPPVKKKLSSIYSVPGIVPQSQVTENTVFGSVYPLTSPVTFLNCVFFGRWEVILATAKGRSED